MGQIKCQIPKNLNLELVWGFQEEGAPFLIIRNLIRSFSAPIFGKTYVNLLQQRRQVMAVLSAVVDPLKAAEI